MCGALGYTADMPRQRLDYGSNLLHFITASTYRRDRTHRRERDVCATREFRMTTMLGNPARSGFPTRCEGSGPSLRRPDLPRFRGGSLLAEEKAGFWKGELEDTVVSYDQKAYTRTYTYDVFQNPEGVVRHELTRTTSTLLEQGRQIHIVDYQEGCFSSFDRGGSVVIRVPLVFPSARHSPLEDREILGFPCQGVETRWVQKRNGYRRVRQTWSPRRGGFRDPLLLLDYAFSGGKLVFFEPQLMRSIGASDALPASLFKVPPGPQVITISDP